MSGDKKGNNPSDYTVNAETFWKIMGAFFWDYSGIGILGIDGFCFLLGAILFSEWTEYHSVHSAPDSRMNRMEGMRFTLNTQNTRSFGKILAGNPSRPLSPIAPGRHGSSQVTSAMGIPFPDQGAFFSKLKLFLNRNKNSPKECTLYFILNYSWIVISGYNYC